MVHASLRAIGPIRGGADGLIDALEAAVGSEGTLLMTLGARDEHAWVNERPVRARAALMRGAEPFDT
jgi:aminoglycoside N3'-acetyltransferase